MSAPTIHECGELCSGRVTDDKLTELGYPVMKKALTCGQWVTIREGGTHGDAVYRAWCDGKVRLCSR